MHAGIYLADISRAHHSIYDAGSQVEPHSIVEVDEDSQAQVTGKGAPGVDLQQHACKTAQSDQGPYLQP